MLNTITIAGRLTRDPEMRRTNSGKPVTSFTLAVDRDANREECDFLDCVAWNKTAEFVDQWFKKGQQAIVSGRLQIRSWTDKNGQNRRTAEIVADHVYFSGDKKSGTDTNVPAGGYQTAPTSDFAELIDDDEQIPF